MAFERKHLRKVLTRKIMQLNDIIADIDDILVDMEVDFYRVCIFGSARIEVSSPFYQQVEALAEALGAMGVDIVTGGGPGLMEAANKGAKKAAGQAMAQTPRSIGLPIHLPFESDANSHLDVKHDHRRFSTRLDEFMRISHAVIVTPGGIGTLLELFYTWQLMQVNHIKPRPLLLLGTNEMWESLLDWMRKWPLSLGLLSASDFEVIKVLSTVPEVVAELTPHIETFRKTHG